MFDHLADPNPPTDTSPVRSRVEYRLRRRRQRRTVGGVVTATAVVVAAALLVATTSSGSGSDVIVGGTPAPSGSRPAPSTSFLVVAGTQRHTKELDLDHRHYSLVTYNGSELQERSVSTGKVEAILLKTSSQNAISASYLPNGDVLVAISQECGATLLAVNPATGTAKTVAHLPDSIEGLSGLSVSPNGKFVAYLASPGCQSGTPIPTTTVATDSTSSSTAVPASSLDYLAIRDLATGATQQVTYASQGTFTGNGPVWSPSGSQLATLSPQGTDTVIFSAEPTLRNEKTIGAPTRCSFNDLGGWTSSGIIEALACEAKVVGRYNPRKPPKQWTLLETLSSSGRAQDVLTASACENVQSIENSTPESPTVVESDNTPAVSTIPPRTLPHCSGPAATRLLKYNDGRLNSITTITGPPISMPS